MDWRLTEAPYTLLPTADHHWRDGLADFNLRANFLDLGGLVLEFRGENRTELFGIMAMLPIQR
jgi:hypothetical protein